MVQGERVEHSKPGFAIRFSVVGAPHAVAEGRAEDVVVRVVVREVVSVSRAVEVVVNEVVVVVSTVEIWRS